MTTYNYDFVIELFVGIIDSYGYGYCIDLLRPIREREQSKNPRIATKGKSNYRWIVGAKLGLVVNWTTAKESDHDTAFLFLVSQYEQQSILLADHGFHGKADDASNPKSVRKALGTTACWLIEAVLPMLTGVCRLKKVPDRVWQGLRARLAFVTTPYNLLVQWHGLRPDTNHTVRLHVAEFSL